MYLRSNFTFGSTIIIVHFPVSTRPICAKAVKIAQFGISHQGKYAYSQDMFITNTKLQCSLCKIASQMYKYINYYCY